jgi:hypothetical protein
VRTLPLTPRDAGRSTRAYYEYGLKNWRRRLRVPLAAGLLLSAGMAYVFWRYSPHGEFYAGLMFGSCLGMFAWVRDEPPEIVAKWRRGADGERLTAKQLRKLRSRGWHAVHDRQGRFGNLDHIVVGPAGVFLLDSKNLSGVVSADSAGVSVRYGEAASDGFTNTRLPAAMRGAAADLKTLLTAATGMSSWVQAVVVIWGDFPAGTVTGDKVEYVRGDLLGEWLLRQPQRLDASTREAIRRGVESEAVIPHATPLVPPATPN